MEVGGKHVVPNELDQPDTALERLRQDAQPVGTDAERWRVNGAFLRSSIEKPTRALSDSVMER